MRISLLLLTFICLAGGAHAQSFMRLKNLQFGPAVSIQAQNQDAGPWDLAPLTKDPQQFPRWNFDSANMRSGLALFHAKVPIGAHVSLLTTWDFYDRKNKSYSKNKEWKVGVEYTTYKHVYRSFENWFFRDNWEKIYFQRKSQHIGLYTDFIFKKQIHKRSSFVYFGAGGSLAYSFGDRVQENRKEYTLNGSSTAIQRYDHAVFSRRDITLLLPVGFELWGSKSVSRVGLNLGMRPGMVLIKEKMLPLFVSPVMGFTARLVYHLH